MNNIVEYIITLSILFSILVKYSEYIINKAHDDTRVLLNELKKEFSDSFSLIEKKIDSLDYSNRQLDKLINEKDLLSLKNILEHALIESIRVLKTNSKVCRNTHLFINSRYAVYKKKNGNGSVEALFEEYKKLKDRVDKNDK